LLVYLPKLETGKFFEGLDMVTQLMGIKPNSAALPQTNPLIQVVGQQDQEDVMEEGMYFPIHIDIAQA